MSAGNTHERQPTNHIITYNWASHLVLSPLIGEPLTAAQFNQYSAYWRENAEDAGIMYCGLHVDPDLPYWGASFMLRAADEDMALSMSATAALEGLSHAGIDVEALEYVSANLAGRERLQTDRETARAAGGAEFDISDPRYELKDQTQGRTAFLEARDFYTDLASLS